MKFAEGGSCSGLSLHPYDHSPRGPFRPGISPGPSFIQVALLILTTDFGLSLRGVVTTKSGGHVVRAQAPQLYFPKRPYRTRRELSCLAANQPELVEAHECLPGHYGIVRLVSA